MNTMIDYMLAVLIGWLVGSLINYLSDTLPEKRRLQRPFCQNCGADFQYLNYIIWPRRCTHCGRSRRWRVFLVELLLIIASVWLWRNRPIEPGYLAGLIIFGYLILVTVIDLEWRLILHVTSLFGLFIGIIIGTIRHGFIPTLKGGAAGFLLMLSLYLLGFLFLRLSKKLRGEALIETEALGFGDVNLGGVIGLLLGWPGILMGLVLAIMLAGFISLIYILYKLARKQYSPNIALPYGPFLAASAVILLFLRNILF